MDRDHCARAFRRVPYYRELVWGRVELWFRKDIPFLRLLEGSKGGEVVKFVDVFHGTPPKYAYKSGGGNLLLLTLNLQGFLLAQQHMTLGFCAHNR